MTTLMNASEFAAALEQARDDGHSKAHPLSTAWSEGKLSKADLAYYATQHYYYIAAIPQQFAHLFVRLPDLESRQHMLENLIGEENPAKPEKRHPELMLAFAEACGQSREDTMAAEYRGSILPSVRAMRSWIWELVGFRTPAEASAGIMVALEGQLPTMYTNYINAMRKQGFTDDDLEFFHVHVEGDEEHADVGLRMCQQYATTPELQQAAIAAVSASVAMRWQMLDSIYSAITTTQSEVA